MPLSERENYLRNATMAGPEWMPCMVVISGASRRQLGEELDAVLARHPILLPYLVRGDPDCDETESGPAKSERWVLTDNWGCQWRSAIEGLEGIAVNPPLADWTALDSYQVPDPLVQADRAPADWEKIRQNIEATRKADKPVTGGLAHGHLFMRLCYLRGFENMMMDMATDEPRLQQLIDMIVGHSRVIIDQYLAMGVDVMNFPEDLGTQTASIMGPRAFARWIAPAYRKLMAPSHQAGVLVYMHSDGYIMDIMDEILACGVDIINPQDLVNGIDNLAEQVKGRVCISLDVDRQSIVPFGSRWEIHDLIEEEVRKLGSPRGGLELVVGIYPPTPSENIDAVCEALEGFRTYWWDGRGND